MKRILVILSLFTSSVMIGQIVTIPDPNFKAALLAIADTNNDGEIQVSEAEVLQYMDVSSHEIESMEGIASFINLTGLVCDDNDMTELNLTQNVNLIEVWCGFNELTEIDLSQNVNLVKFDCNGTLISNFDFSNNLDLAILRVFGSTQLTSLDVSLNQSLEEINCSFSALTSLISPNPNLTFLDCSRNQLSTVDISQSPNLEHLNTTNNNLTELNVTQNQNLEFLFFDLNSLNTIDISQNPNLVELSGSGNELSALDLSSNPNLAWLDCSSNLLTGLDFTNNPAIYYVHTEFNLITELDFSQNTLLESLLCFDNQLVSLNVQNGNNATFNYCHSFNNPNLACIQVDDPSIPINNPNWGTNSTTIYSLDCSLGFDDNEALKAIIYPNPVREILTVESRETIETIEVYSILGELITSESRKGQIDFSTYAKGVYFIKVETEKGSVFQKVLKE